MRASWACRQHYVWHLILHCAAVTTVVTIGDSNERSLARINLQCDRCPYSNSSMTFAQMAGGLINGVMISQAGDKSRTLVSQGNNKGDRDRRSREDDDSNRTTSFLSKTPTISGLQFSRNESEV
ncbi:hypothetical protein SCLCIDRAFT_176475 [Scleroderma citrinum Foug A]|uniref:Uncharacterized protein n=1 Tax=Scleroderma citrinum Foug A TaxID=1036808 RepID=A0A0C3EE02_9AGAM|nr:hypothetical protein SCLCIDRAFT_176475 [Scleroderma citrinum Foug A]